jgi:predicted nucleotidyltransferase
MTILEDLKKIYDCFGNENIVICGSLSDFYWINFKNPSDIDIIVNIKSLMRYFQIENLTKKINKFNFDIGYFHEVDIFKTPFYKGKYFESKIDIFLIDDIKTNFYEDYIVLYESKFEIDNIMINSPKKRISELTLHSNYTINDTMSEWQKKWIFRKKTKAKAKLFMYKHLFPTEWS